MIENMTKKDLEERMVVETRAGNRYLVCGNSIIRNKGYCYLSDYNDNLTAKFSSLDIVKVYDVVSTLEDITDPNLTLIWERKDNHPKVGDVYIDNDGYAFVIYDFNNDNGFYHAFNVFHDSYNKLRYIEMTYCKEDFNDFKFVENNPRYVASLQHLMMTLSEKNEQI